MLGESIPDNMGGRDLQMVKQAHGIYSQVPSKQAHGMRAGPVT